MADGAGAVAEDAFDCGGEFAEGAVILDDFEERVVAKAADTGGLRQNSAAAGADAFGMDDSAGVGQRGVAGVVGPAAVEWHGREFFK